MTAEPQKNAPEGGASEEDWEREQEEAERAMLAERVGLVVGGRYKIVRTLGAGGMGGVYEAEHELIGKKVALKCLHREYTRDRDLVERFKREARAATAIGNEHIVDVTDMGDLPDGAPFLVMEYLQGTTLNGLIDDDGPMRIPRAVHIARQVCDALGAAHEKGIVHRDLKPENVFLTRRGHDPDFVKVLDFGISKMHSSDRKDRGLTRTGMAIGTPSYMSPEQAQGLRDVDARTDIWAMGVIIYEMLAGRRPFEADSYPMLLMRIVGSEPDPITKWRKDIPEPLNAIIMRCLEKPVATRMGSMRELESALAQFADVDRAPELAPEELRGEPDRASGTLVRGKRASDAPPGAAGSGVRSSHASPQATRVHGSSDTPAPKAASSAPPAGAPSASPVSASPVSASPVSEPPAARTAARTAEIGSVARREKPERTKELGSVLRDEADGDRDDAVAPIPAKNNTTLVIVAVAALVVIAIGVGWAIAGGGSAPASTTVSAPPTSVALPPPTTTVAAPPTTLVAVPTPTEVRVRISVMPIDSRITIEDVEFPNPMDAMQPRQLTPVHIRVERDGYRTLERLAIFDSDQNFHFELSRGRGVQHIGVTGDEVPAEGAHPHEETPPPSTATTGHGDGFRDQF